MISSQRSARFWIHTLCLCLTGGTQFSTIPCSGQQFFACPSPSLPCKVHELYWLLQHALGPQGACTAHRWALEEAMERAISQIDYCCGAQMPKVMPIICLCYWEQLTRPAEDSRSQGEEGGSGGCCSFHSLPSLQEK